MNAIYFKLATIPNLPEKSIFPAPTQRAEGRLAGQALAYNNQAAQASSVFKSRSGKRGMRLLSSFAVLLVVLLAARQAHAVIVFQQPTSFGTMQVQLTTTTGFISTGTSNTFNFANPGYQNIVSLGLALCGYDIPTPTTLQFRAEASFDNAANAIVVLILPLNATKLAFINYYLIIVTDQALSFLSLQNTCLTPPYNPFNTSFFGRAQSYTLPSPFAMSGNKVSALPFVRSVNNVVADSYNSLLITGVTTANNNNFNLTILNNFTYQAEVCLSVLFYYDTVGLKLNLQNVSYSPNFLLINASSPTQNLASVSQINFTLNSMYGPVFNRKCLVGFQGFKMTAKTRQTISFNLTGNGIYGLISSANYQVSYAWLCMATIACQGSLSQYYPAINDCEAPCAIANCSICQTSTSCSVCSGGFFLNTLYRCSACLLNCNNCTNASVCQACSNGYYYNGSACLACAQFCSSCTATSCKGCLSGYYINGFQCINCASVLPNCLLCATGTACSTCPSGYYSSGNSGGCLNCSQALVGCALCSIASICTKCATGYYLNGPSCKTCIYSVASCCPTFVSNCSICKNATTCTLCSIGYFLSSGGQACVACNNTLANCVSCSGPTACLLCNTSYFLNPYNQCVSCGSSISQCATCPNSTYCSFCQLPFLMVNGSCLDCPIWPTNNLYFLDQDSVCQPCSAATPDCLRCNDLQQCLQCSDLFFLTPSNNACNLCSDFINNCLACESASACAICTSGYFPDRTNSSACSKCEDRIAHCTSCSDVLDSSKGSYSLMCMGCRQEYYLNGSICSPCIEAIPFCLLCSNNFQCVDCEAGYFLGSTMTCIPCGELIAGCTGCQSSSVCLSCAAGYYLINNYCTECRMALNNCYSCAPLNATLTCASCLPGYYLAANFTCAPCNASLQFCSKCSSPTTCSSCMPGYTVNYNFTCSPCTYLIPACQYCSTTACLKCQDNYLLNVYGDCYSCDYYLTGCALCQYVLSNATGQNNLNCTACLAGYLIYQASDLAKCIACNVTIPNCQACASLTVCSACNALSFLNSKNTCSLCSLYLPHCVFCNTSSACLQCTPSYYLNSNQTCEYCDPSQFGNDGSVLKLPLCLNCQYMSTVPTCFSCISGYYVSANRCLSCRGVINNCLTCASSSTCIQCQTGYYLTVNGNQCVNCPIALTYCARCDLNGICIQCDADCYLDASSNTCIKCFQVTAGCNSCSNGTCLGCLDGYYMVGLACMSCSAVFQDCLLCSNATACSLYSSNYTVSTSNSNLLTTFTPNVWMYVALGCFGGVAVIATAFLIWRKCRKPEETRSEASNATKTQTERQLHREQQQSNDVEIGHRELCQCCKVNKFDVMNVELLCGRCEQDKKGSRDHLIRREVKPKKSRLESRPMMEKQSETSSKKSSDDDNLIASSSNKSAGSDKVNEELSLRPRIKQTESMVESPKKAKRSEGPGGEVRTRKKVSNSHI